jgi:hypothetical protein
MGAKVAEVTIQAAAMLIRVVPIVLVISKCGNRCFVLILIMAVILRCGLSAGEDS